MLCVDLSPVKHHTACGYNVKNITKPSLILLEDNAVRLSKKGIFTIFQDLNSAFLHFFIDFEPLQEMYPLHLFLIPSDTAQYNIGN